MPIRKEPLHFGLPYEKEGYGFAQGIKTGDTIYLSGQVAADRHGADMEAQMRQAYASIAKSLAEYGATMENVVDEIIFVTDIKTAAAVAGKVRAEAYFGLPVVASTLIHVADFSSPDLLVEIKCVAKV